MPYAMANESRNYLSRGGCRGTPLQFLAQLGGTFAFGFVLAEGKKEGDTAWISILSLQ